ncbi:hypothetical protein XENOCAPTIV_024247 [Xenoophorus captivus]|uniref:Uncharacterized protein n=1 Tax=Xenoophorus captivus TaxID=1517983 RepID=A0ABV0R3I3_9TELE
MNARDWRMRGRKGQKGILGWVERSFEENEGRTKRGLKETMKKNQESKKDTKKEKWLHWMDELTDGWPAKTDQCEPFIKTNMTSGDPYIYHIDTGPGDQF